jgi:hypothetical protein
MQVETFSMTHQNDEQPELDPVDDARVTDALNALGTVEPPAEFVGQVVWRTRHRAVKQGAERHSRRRNGEELDMAKKVLIGVIGIAAVGLVVAYIAGVPPTSHTEGTIGAAQRYQAEQIKKSDVKVANPELQAFMQTDAFDKIVHDKQALAALASPEVQALLADQNFQLALNADLLQVLANPALTGAMADHNVQIALANAQVAAALSASGVQGIQAALAGPELQASGAEVKAALQSSAFQAALANPTFLNLMASPGFQGLMANPTLAQAMLSAQFQAALQASGLQAALANPQFIQGLAASGFVQQLSLQASGLAASGLNASGASGLAASGADGK